MAGEWSVGSATVDLIADLSKLSKGLDDAESMTQSKSSKIGSIFSTAFSFATGTVLADGIMKAGSVVTDFFTGGIADARDAAKVFAQTEAVIASTGGAAGMTAQQVADMSSSLSAAAGKSLFGDDDITRGTDMLLTFTNIKDTLPETTQVMVDLAQATGTDMKGAALQLGKALNDPTKGISALSRVGVSFTKQQKDQIAAMQKAGDLAGAQRVILSELNKEFGGSAEAAAKADGGWAQLKDSLGELGESMGGKVLPVLGKVAKILNSPAVQGAITNLAEGFATLVAGGLDWLVSTGLPLLITGWDKLTGIWNDASDATSGLGETIGFIVDDFLGFTDTIGPLQSLGIIFDHLASAVQTAGAALLQGDWAGAWAAIKSGFTDVWGDIQDLLIPALGDIWTALSTWVVAQAPVLVTQLQTWATAFVAWIAPMIPPFLAQLATLAQGLWDWIVAQAAPLLAQLQTWATAFVAWIGPATVTFLEQWPTMFNQFLDWIGAQAGPLLAKLGDWAVQFVAWIIPMIPGFLLALGAIAVAIVTFVGETAITLGAKILTDWVPAWLNWIKDSVIPKLGPALMTMLNAILAWITGTALPWLTENTKQLGTYFIDGVKIGINDAMASLNAAVTSVFQGAMTLAQNIVNGAIENILGFITHAIQRIQALIDWIGRIPSIHVPTPSTGGGGTGGGTGGASFDGLGGSNTYFVQVQDGYALNRFMRQTGN